MEQVVVSLTEKGNKKHKSADHIPYRQSKLTHLLKDSIGGNCRTVMIATAWPEETHIAVSVVFVVILNFIFMLYLDIINFIL